MSYYSTTSIIITTTITILLFILGKALFYSFSTVKYQLLSSFFPLLTLARYLCLIRISPCFFLPVSFWVDFSVFFHRLAFFLHWISQNKWE